MLMRMPGMMGGRQRGMSIVELMVGIAIGLVIVAAATLLMSGQLSENRRLLVETQLQQDLRAATDIITRELRRTGSLPEINAMDTIWYEGSAKALPNLMAPTLAVNAGLSKVDFNYASGSNTNLTGPYGFKLDSGIIKTLLGTAGWQDLTDGNVMNVLSFAITLDTATPTLLPCPKLCADGTTNCWPTVVVREVDIQITAEAKRFPEVKRSMSTRARLRNDYVTFFDWAGKDICPL